MTNWQRWKNIMKCYPFEEKRLMKWEPPYIVQPKYDGFRCRAIYLDQQKNWLLLSSEENIIFSVPHINESLKLSGLNNVELDGELYLHGMDFNKISSIVSRTQNLHPDHKLMQFHIFDYVSGEAQGFRVANLSNNLNLEPPLIISPFWLCNTFDEVMKTYNELISWGYEGMIVRNAYTIYERKRSTYVMKFKPKKSDTYEIIGYQEEVDKNGIPKGTLGSVVCKSGDGNTFSIGSGFTRKQREELWEIKETLPSRKCRAEYQHLTSGNKVPRFPIFMEVI